MKFDRTPIELLDIDKQFTDGDNPLGFSAVDYWQFQFSNVWDLYEEVAEFIVAKALGMAKPFNKNGWTPFDILYNGKRVEVKATAYYHSWRGDNDYSENRSFSIAETVGQHNEKKDEPERQNDVYVFCLNTGKNQKDADPFEMRHWEFYVVPTCVINKECGNNKSISLGRLRKITKEQGKVNYSQLKAAIDTALAESGTKR